MRLEVQRRQLYRREGGKEEQGMVSHATRGRGKR